MEKYTDKPIILFELPLFGGSMTALLSILRDRLTGGAVGTKQPLTIVTPNPEQVVMTRNNPQLLAAMQDASIRIPDGIGLVYASKLLSKRGEPSLQQRVPGRVVVESLLKLAHERKLSVLVLGGRELGDEKGKLLPILLENGASLHADNWHWSPGYQQVSVPTPEEQRSLEKTLLSVKPDIAFVCFGAPFQEQWLTSHGQLLEKSGVRVAMVAGGTFDVLTGKLQRPPRWMQRSGLEWLFRLWQEPWRWRRQLSLVTFVGIVMGELFGPDNHTDSRSK